MPEKQPRRGTDPGVERVAVSAYSVPTDGPQGEESDGTLTWHATTLILVEVRAANQVGIGYSYSDRSAASFIASKLAPLVLGKNPLLPAAIWHQMMRHIRNDGRPGLGAMAVSAVDIALQDLRAKLMGLPLFSMLGAFRDRVPIYGSGGFCNYPIDRLVKQLSGWVEQGIQRVKLKTSRHPAEDPRRLNAVRAAIGDQVGLMTDANGALERKQALYWAHRFRDEWQVEWLEEPVSSDDLEGLRLLRDHAGPGLEIAAGEYGFVLRDFTDLLLAGAVDCLQADVTRCGGITGLLQVAGLSAAHGIDLSAHCAPTVSAHAFCAAARVRHLEYFHDHARVERLLFDGALSPQHGLLVPDAARPGLGIELKRQDAEAYRLPAASAVFESSDS